jgi:GAF domain-containing protein
MGRARTLEDLYQAALDALAQGLGVVRSSILLFDPDGVMRFKASRGLSPYYQRAVEGHTPWRPDTPDPRPIVVSDAAREPSLQPYREIIAAEGIAAMAFIPLASDGRVIGKFMLYSDVHRAFTADELQLAGVIAAQVAFAVVRARSEAAAIERRPLLVSELIDSALTSVIPAAEAKPDHAVAKGCRGVPPFTTMAITSAFIRFSATILSNARSSSPLKRVSSASPAMSMRIG